jgi:uncharacterized protein
MMISMKSIWISSIDKIDLHAAIHTSKRKHAIGGIIQVHGITTDMDGGGQLIRLAEKLADSGFDVLRFSFRGHGKSGGTQRGVTVAGEMLDLQAAFNYASKAISKPQAIIAVSFGAVSTCLLLPYLRSCCGLVLWNPALDLKSTFFESNLAGGTCNFSEESLERLTSKGYLHLATSSFEIGNVLYEEIKQYDPYHAFIKSSVPAIIIQASHDTCVDQKVSRTACEERNNCKLHIIKDSDHCFSTREKEDEVIAGTVNWLEQLFGACGA